MMFATRRLLLAEVVSLRDGTRVTYPACQICYSKVFLDTTSERYSCVKCCQHYGRKDVILRYRLSVAVTDGTALCNVTIFGKTLDKLFGCSASDLSRVLTDLKDSYSCDVEEMFTEALATVLVGRMFYFGFKLKDLLKNDKKVNMTIKDLRNCNERNLKHSSNHSGFIALQMIPACEEDSTKPATAMSVLKELLHQENVDCSSAQTQEISTADGQNENSEAIEENDYNTCANHEEQSLYNKTDLILSCESLHQSLSEENDHRCCSVDKETKSSPGVLHNKARRQSCEPANGLFVTNVDLSHQSLLPEHSLCLEECNMPVTDLPQSPRREKKKEDSAFDGSVIPSSGCSVFSKHCNISSTLNKIGSFNIKQRYASLSDRSSLLDTSAPYSEELDLFLQDLENELVFCETSVIPEISNTKLVCEQNLMVSVSHHITQNVSKLFPEDGQAKSQCQPVRVGSSNIATPDPCHCSRSISQLDVHGQNVNIKQALDDCSPERSLDDEVKGSNICEKSLQATDKGTPTIYLEHLQHFQHGECEQVLLSTQEKCSVCDLLVLSTICISDRSCDRFDRSTDLFMDSANWSSFVANKENSVVSRLSQPVCGYSCIASPGFGAVTKPFCNQNKIQIVNKKSVHFPCSDMLTVSLREKSDTDLGITFSPLATVRVPQKSATQRRSSELATGKTINSTGNTRLHPISSTPKANWPLSSKPAENPRESSTIQSYSSLISSQDLFDQSSSQLYDYSDSPLSLPFSTSHHNQKDVSLLPHDIVTGQNHNLCNASFKNCTPMKIQTSLHCSINSLHASDSSDRSEICDCSEDLFSEKSFINETFSEESNINETIITSINGSENLTCLSQNSDCSKDLFDDS